MQDPKDLRIEEFTYDLPDDRIARYPLDERDTSRLLVYKDGEITEDVFRNLPQQLPANALIVFNQTRVVHARLFFQKPTGGRIEIFCLSPDTRYPDVTTAFAQKGKVYWQCIVGGAAKWKEGVELQAIAEGGLTITAIAVERGREAWIIEFSWDDAAKTFAEVLQRAGKVPLPPYLNRDVDEGDEHRYQTVFAKEEGSVAAPTASLHFTDQVLQDIAALGIQTAMLTLHVGAGTFLPVKSETMSGHAMHSEWIEVNIETIQQLIDMSDGLVIATGTTAMRTLESLYWIGCKALRNPNLNQLVLTQWEAYEVNEAIYWKEALHGLADWMKARNQTRFISKTGILIAPGYTFRIVTGLITNFHQPQSTLLLLVAAFIGNDWKKVYQYAADNSFRFLSYGDTSLLWKKE